MSPDGEQRDAPRRRSPWSYMGMGFELVVPILLGAFVGNWLDSRFDTDPWLLLVGSLLGIAVGSYTFLRTVISLIRGGP